MSSTPLSTLLKESLELLGCLLSDDCSLLEDMELAGLIHAAWMRLKNWESDIKNNERSTLEELINLSPLTAEIVRGRLESLLHKASLVKDVCSVATGGENSTESRALVEETFEAAVDVSETTLTLRRLIGADKLAVEIEQFVKLAEAKSANSPTIHSGQNVPLDHVSWHFDSCDTYRLTKSSVEDFLTGLFGLWEFDVKVINDKYVFMVPRDLTENEKMDLRDKRWPE